MYDSNETYIALIVATASGAHPALAGFAARRVVRLLLHVEAIITVIIIQEIPESGLRIHPHVVGQALALAGLAALGVVLEGVRRNPPPAAGALEGPKTFPAREML